MPNSNNGMLHFAHDLNHQEWHSTSSVIISPLPDIGLGKLLAIVFIPMFHKKMSLNLILQVENLGEMCKGCHGRSQYH
jgi:hypothetical protein